MSRIPFVETIEDSRVRGIHPATGRRALVETTDSRREVRIYCISCHCPGGFVSVEMPGVIYLCDQFAPCGHDCQHTKGELPLPRLAL